MAIVKDKARGDAILDTHIPRPGRPLRAVAKTSAPTLVDGTSYNVTLNQANAGLRTDEQV